MTEDKDIEMRQDENGQWSMYSSNYSPSALWDKLKRYAKMVGCEGIRNVLRLYYALDNKDMPRKVKLIIYGALGYFILPVDVIPDVIPVIGFTDDLGIIAAAIGVAAMYINAEVKTKADEKLVDWFGPGVC